MNQPNQPAPKSADMPVSKQIMSDCDYWMQRCQLAENCLEESPCDPDITSEQIKAHNAYHKFISWAGNGDSYNSPRYVPDEEIDAMWPDRNESGTMLDYNIARREAAKAMRDKIFNNVKPNV